MEFLDLPPMMSAAGRVRLPGSKSISNRVLLLAALSEGETEVRDLLKSDDTDRMLDALRVLGVEWSHDQAQNVYRVAGVSGCFPNRQADLFLGNAGTAFRPLTAALALAEQVKVLVLAKGAIDGGSTAWAQGGPKAKGESPRVLGQGQRLGRADGHYIGVYNTNTHVGGHRPAASLSPTV